MLDKDTIKKMSEHRCGIRDPHVVVPESALASVPGSLRMKLKPEVKKRVRRYNHQGTTWKKVRGEGGVSLCELFF